VVKAVNSRWLLPEWAERRRLRKRADRWLLPEWAERPIYQVYWRSFFCTTGSGVGDLEGVRQKLDYLASLKVDIWFNPWYVSDMEDGGYDVRDFLDIDPVAGTMEGFVQLLAECRPRNIRVIMDLPMCHTSDKHPWFLGAIAGDPVLREYYVIRPGKNGGPPNNWLSKFGGSAWTLLPGSDNEYYLHTWGSFQPKLNLRNPRVRRELVQIMSFWLKKGVSGFRLDYVPNAIEDKKLRDNPPNPKFVPGMPEDEALLTTFTEYLPEMYRVVAEITRKVAKLHPGCFLLPEAYPPGMGRLHLAYDRLYKVLNPRHAVPLNFSLMFVKKEAAKLQAWLDQFMATLRPHRTPVFALSNHDRPRPASEGEMGPDLAMAMLVFMLFLPGKPCIYYGQELNLGDIFVPLGQRKDPQTKPRDGCRGVLPWDPSPTGGFCADDVTPWMPVDHSTSVAEQMEDPASPLRVTQRAIQLRRELPALARGGYEPLPTSNPEHVVSFARAADGQRAHVYMNLSKDPQEVTIDEATSRFLLASSGDTGSGRITEGTLMLRGEETVLLAS
jgi:alpha-glucosidase